MDKDGNIIFSRRLSYERFGKAFGGNEISLQMKDGSTQKIKDHWFDYGSYKLHGDFVRIAADTLESLQKCYCYCGYNINADIFRNLLDDYYTRDREYEYDEIRKWVRLQYEWHKVIINGKQYPLMVNKYGNFVDKHSKELVFARNDCSKMCYYNKTGKSFNFCIFKWQYNNGDRLVKIEKKMLDVLVESLPYSEEDIISNCKLPNKIKNIKRVFR